MSWQRVRFEQEMPRDKKGWGLFFMFGSSGKFQCVAPNLAHVPQLIGVCAHVMTCML